MCRYLQRHGFSALVCSGCSEYLDERKHPLKNISSALITGGLLAAFCFVAL
jgi:hypothetical protein